MITAYVPKPSGYKKPSNYDESSKKVEIWDKAYTSPKTVRETVWDIYQQGRADKYQEITSEYMLLTEKQVEEIRAEVIEEVKQKLNRTGVKITFNFPVEEIDSDNLAMLIQDVIREYIGVLDQLKEQQA